MEKEIHLRISKRTYEELEKVRIEKKLEDRQDLMRIILEKELFKKSIFLKIKNYLFK